MADEKQKPKGDSYYNKRARNYEARRRKQAWWQVEQDQMAAHLDMLPRGLSVVDVPFGTGRFVDDYLARDYRVHGFDASSHMLNAARVALGDETYERCHCDVADAARLPVADGAFDLIVSTRFLRDIVTFGAAKRMLSEFARVTRGHAILQLGHDLDGATYPDDDDVMAGRLTMAQLRDLLGSAGFEIADRKQVKDDGNGLISHFLCTRRPA